MIFRKYRYFVSSVNNIVEFEISRHNKLYINTVDLKG
jgi:hypothetical protein